MSSEINNLSKVYISDLSEDVDEKDLQAICRTYGAIRNIWIAPNPPKYALVEYENPVDASDLVRDMHGVPLCGRPLHVELFTTKGDTRKRKNSSSCSVESYSKHQSKQPKSPEPRGRQSFASKSPEPKRSSSLARSVDSGPSSWHDPRRVSGPAKKEWSSSYHKESSPAAGLDYSKRDPRLPRCEDRRDNSYSERRPSPRNKYSSSSLSAFDENARKGYPLPLMDGDRYEPPSEMRRPNYNEPRRNDEQRSRRPLHQMTSNNRGTTPDDGDWDCQVTRNRRVGLNDRSLRNWTRKTGHHKECSPAADVDYSKRDPRLPRCEDRRDNSYSERRPSPRNKYSSSSLSAFDENARKGYPLPLMDGDRYEPPSEMRRPNYNEPRRNDEQRSRRPLHQMTSNNRGTTPDDGDWDCQVTRNWTRKTGHHKECSPAAGLDYSKRDPRLPRCEDRRDNSYSERKPSPRNKYSSSSLSAFDENARKGYPLPLIDGDRYEPPSLRSSYMDGRRNNPSWSSGPTTSKYRGGRSGSRNWDDKIQVNELSWSPGPAHNYQGSRSWGEISKDATGYLRRGRGATFYDRSGNRGKFASSSKYLGSRNTSNEREDDYGIQGVDRSRSPAPAMKNQGITPDDGDWDVEEPTTSVKSVMRPADSSCRGTTPDDGDWDCYDTAAVPSKPNNDKRADKNYDRGEGDWDNKDEKAQFTPFELRSSPKLVRSDYRRRDSNSSRRGTTPDEGDWDCDVTETTSFKRKSEGIVLTSDNGDWDVSSSAPKSASTKDRFASSSQDWNDTMPCTNTISKIRGTTPDDGDWDTEENLPKEKYPSPRSEEGGNRRREVDSMGTRDPGSRTDRGYLEKDARATNEVISRTQLERKEQKCDDWNCEQDTRRSTTSGYAGVTPDAGDWDTEENLPKKKYPSPRPEEGGNRRREADSMGTRDPGSRTDRGYLEKDARATNEVISRTQLERKEQKCDDWNREQDTRRSTTSGYAGVTPDAGDWDTEENLPKEKYPPPRSEEGGNRRREADSMGTRDPGSRTDRGYLEKDARATNEVISRTQLERKEQKCDDWNCEQGTRRSTTSGYAGVTPDDGDWD
ncbi:unnamed protein product [Hermetia illucens]|uniref:RRM domain-containing protein n=1 Tax=Hermetia illucens TaxID=343691 RepID=A0A7R8UUN7_HERIL|nr:unnamed protein product [Hermetia illucens]